MGGRNSGRTATQPTLEDGLRLDLSLLLRQGNVVPGERTGGILTWTRRPSGDCAGSIGYEADLSNLDRAWLRLHYTATRPDGTAQAMDYQVALTSKPLHFGGRRWWFVCPLTGHRAAKLCMPPGAERFGSRRAFRVAYRSQRGGPLDATHARQRRIVGKLRAEYRHSDPPPPARPKWMRRKTYERLLHELEAAVQAHNSCWAAGSVRLMKRWQ